MASTYVKIQTFQHQFFLFSPSQDLVHVFLQNIGHRRDFSFLIYEARHSKVWSPCPCSRLTIATPWCWPWISSNVSFSVPLCLFFWFHPNRQRWTNRILMVVSPSSRIVWWLKIGFCTRLLIWCLLNSMPKNAACKWQTTFHIGFLIAFSVQAWIHSAWKFKQFSLS